MALSDDPEWSEQESHSFSESFHCDAPMHGELGVSMGETPEQERRERDDWFEREHKGHEIDSPFRPSSTSTPWVGRRSRTGSNASPYKGTPANTILEEELSSIDEDDEDEVIPPVPPKKAKKSRFCSIL